MDNAQADALRSLCDLAQQRCCARRLVVDWFCLVGILLLVALSVVRLAAQRSDRKASRPQLPSPVAGVLVELDRPVRIGLLHGEPCIRFLENILSAAEADHIISTYRKDLERSTVAVRKPGATKDDVSSARTSSTAFLPTGHSDPIIHGIEKRLVLLTGVPSSHWEALQMTHYSHGQQYKPHTDFFAKAANNRAVTVFVYLNDVREEDEGTTDFTRLDLRVQPKKGCGVIWYNCQARGDRVVCDALTEHAGRPPLRGEKFGLNCWARTGVYRPACEGVGRRA